MLALTALLPSHSMTTRNIRRGNVLLMFDTDVRVGQTFWSVIRDIWTGSNACPKDRHVRQW